VCVLRVPVQHGSSCLPATAPAAATTTVLFTRGCYAPFVRAFGSSCSFALQLPRGTVGVCVPVLDGPARLHDHLLRDVPLTARADARARA
jgi:hypothetical protein